jgi:hypothetical protein
MRGLNHACDSKGISRPFQRVCRSVAGGQYQIQSRHLRGSLASSGSRTVKSKRFKLRKDDVAFMAKVESPKREAPTPTSPR